jgi:hypothetical protein
MKGADGRVWLEAVVVGGRRGVGSAMTLSAEAGESLFPVGQNAHALDPTLPIGCA